MFGRAVKVVGGGLAHYIPIWGRAETIQKDCNK